jgi:hypothetical protein
MAMMQWRTDSTAWLLVATVLATASAVVAWLGAAARRAGLSAAMQRRLTVGASLGFAVWLAFAAMLAQEGVFQDFDAVPPRLPLLPVGLLVVVLVFTSLKGFRRLLDAAPAEWLIALQSYRVGIELILYVMFLGKLVPVQMTFEGGNLDILIGLSAPLMAFAAHKHWGGRWLFIGWNTAGLLSVANIVRTVMRSLPGPLHADGFAVSPTIVAFPPFVWLPAFVVPIAILGHLISLRQLPTATRVATAPLPSAR